MRLETIEKRKVDNSITMLFYTFIVDNVRGSETVVWFSGLTKNEEYN